MSSPILHNLSPRRLISQLSVRARIIAITLIPVLGFLANGVAYVAGEHEVDRAVDSVERQRRSPTPAASSRARPAPSRPPRAASRCGRDRAYLQTLSDAQAAAAAQFVAILQLSDGAAADPISPPSSARWRGCREISASCATSTSASAATSDSGIRAKLAQAALEVERIISLDMSWLTEIVAHQPGREPVVDAPLRGGTHARPQFRRSHRLHRRIRQVQQDSRRRGRGRDSQDPDPSNRAQLCGRVRQLGRFGPRDREPRRRHRFRFGIPDPQRRRQCRALERAAQPRRRGAQHVASADAQHHHPGRPGRRDARDRLQLVDRPDHHPAARRPGRRDEAARRRRHFGENPVDAGEGRARRHGARGRRVPRQHDRARAARRDAGRDQSRARSNAANRSPRPSPASRLSIDQVLAKLREAVQRLEIASTQLNGAADQVSTEARTAEERVGIASGNVTTAAGSVEELAASISGIAEQATRSTESRRPRRHRGAAHDAHDVRARRCRNPYRRRRSA